MTNFTLMDSSYEQIVPMLKEAVPSFVVSPEYRSIAEHDDLAGVMLAAFGRFLVRLTNSADDKAELEAGVAAVNNLFDRPDADIRTAIRDEFVPMFDGAVGAGEGIGPLLSAPLKQAFTELSLNDASRRRPSLG